MKRHPSTPKAAAHLGASIDRCLDQELFRALADGTRLRVLSCLVKCGRACSVTEIAESSSVDFSVVNKHLKVLASAGILDAEKRGRTVWYTARCGDLSGRLSALVDAIAEWCPNLAADSPEPARSTGAPCCGAARRRPR
jgi:DNA-binding transcriptional ArsR family regulator